MEEHIEKDPVSGFWHKPPITKKEPLEDTLRALRWILKSKELLFGRTSIICWSVTIKKLMFSWWFVLADLLNLNSEYFRTHTVTCVNFVMQLAKNGRIKLGGYKGLIKDRRIEYYNFLLNPKVDGGCKVKKDHMVPFLEESGVNKPSPGKRLAPIRRKTVPLYTLTRSAPRASSVWDTPQHVSKA